jgi:hypothetical protein
MGAAFDVPYRQQLSWNHLEMRIWASCDVAGGQPIPNHNLIRSCDPPNALPKDGSKHTQNQASTYSI